MTVADEPEYFEGSVALDKATGNVEVSAYSETNCVYLMALGEPLLILTTKQAHQLGRYLLKASKKARIHKREKCR